MTERRVLGVPSAQVGHVWQAVAPMLERAIRHGDGGYEVADLLSSVRSTDMQLWLGYANGRLEIAAVTEIALRPRKKVLRVVALAGKKIDAWINDGLPVIEAFGRAKGCEEIEMQGRKGWLRKLPWVSHHVVMRKGL